MKNAISVIRKFRVEIRDPQGRMLHDEEFKNITVNTGLDDILAKYWKGSGYTAAHYVGLTQGAPTIAANDTMASHTGWSEQTGYNEAARQGLTLGAVSGQSVDNSAAKAVFTITADGTTVGGAFITTDDTKGGSAGILIAGAAFSGGNQVLGAGSTISITITNSMASA